MLNQHFFLQHFVFNLGDLRNYVVQIHLSNLLHSSVKNITDLPSQRKGF
jgi:hypothetical protein